MRQLFQRLLNHAISRCCLRQQKQDDSQTEDDNVDDDHMLVIEKFVKCYFGLIGDSTQVIKSNIR